MSGVGLDWRANAEANLLSARQRHGNRLGSKKSRNGCLTCRARRVKCDERRPACRRCQDGSRECNYRRSPSSDDEKDLSPVIGVSPSQLKALRDSDRRTFDYFISYTAPRLAGVWDKEFWCIDVLQLAHREPFVLDSLLAISVLYEYPQYMASFSGKPGHAPDADYPGTSFESPTPLDGHHMRALGLYNRAIRSFSAQLTDGHTSHAVALLSCVLFICIETMRDDMFAVMTLFTHGRNMLKRVQRDTLTSDETSMLAIVEHTFERMAVQAVLYGHPDGRPLREDIDTNASHRFESLSDARSALFSLIFSGHSFMNQADAWRQAVIDAKLGLNTGEQSDESLHGIENLGRGQNSWSMFHDARTDGDSLIEERGTLNALRSFLVRLGQSSSRDPPDTRCASLDTHSLISERTKLLEGLERWKEDFQNLLARTESEPLAEETLSCLKMCYLASRIWIATRLETMETTFDQYTAQFRELIQNAETYVRSIVHPTPVFTFEVGALLPLFLVAFKCRVPSVRRQALDLMLRCPKKESHFGAYSSAQTICRLIAIEERGTGLPPPDLSGRSALRALDDSIVIPEDSRVHSFDLLKNRNLQNFEMRATRYSSANGRFERVVEDFAI